ncbi:MAG: phospho-N-acetylmuramoyl-pentapeptide-transferase [Oscillospiraceae bacterium]|nr:phospho-N-acetylmuramoyl-pentapeptide-transferase [Oscillospiraceae bacterium]
MILKLLWALVGSLLATTVMGVFLVPYLRKIKAGQSIRTDGPTWHMSKQGTPTMGGLMFITGITFAVLTGGIEEMAAGDWRHVIILVFSLIFGFIGFLDDYEKLKKKQNLGLTALQKLALQVAAAIVLCQILHVMGHLSPTVYVPFVNVSFTMPYWLYLIFAVFVTVGTVNAVNITDGIDGLAAGVSLPVALCYAALAAVWGYTSVGVFGAAMAGGLAGFLIFNFFPAKIFMGDTGSLFLGGAVAATAFALDMPLVLIPLGIIYIIETMSDIIQVGYFKLTHGKRIFKMAPIHHHLEMCGWGERRIFAVFTAISAAFALLTFFGVQGRFGI